MVLKAAERHPAKSWRRHVTISRSAMLAARRLVLGRLVLGRLALGRLVLGVVALAGLALGAGGCGSPPDDPVPTLRFTAIPDDNTTELTRKFQPVADYLSRQLNVPVEYVPSADYGASVEMFKNADIHLAWFGGLTGVQARQAVPGSHAIVQGVEDPAFYSYFIANRSTGLEPSDDFPLEIRDFLFTFGSTKSTSGRLMPEHFIREHSGRSPREFFTREYGFSGSHDKTIEQVSAGAYDVGAVSYATFDAWLRDGRVDTLQVQVIWQTPDYADYNFTAHPDLEEIFGPGFIERLQEALIAMKAPEFLDAFRRTGFIPASDDDFAAVLDVAQALNMAR